MTAWLRCKLDEGMFSDEVAVTYPANNHQWRKSVFVPRACVRLERSDVRVDVIDRDGRLYAVLPSPRRDIVQVEGADLSQQ